MHKCKSKNHIDRPTVFKAITFSIAPAQRSTWVHNIYNERQNGLFFFLYRLTITFFNCRRINIERYGGDTSPACTAAKKTCVSPNIPYNAGLLLIKESLNELFFLGKSGIIIIGIIIVFPPLGTARSPVKPRNRRLQALGKPYHGASIHKPRVATLRIRMRISKTRLASRMECYMHKKRRTHPRAERQKPGGKIQRNTIHKNTRKLA